MASAANLSSLLTHLRHVESTLTKVLMEATLKLSSLTDASVFVLFDTAEGRRFGGSDALVDAFLEGRLEPGARGRRVTTRLDEASFEISEQIRLAKNEIVENDRGRESTSDSAPDENASIYHLDLKSSKGPSPEMASPPLKRTLLPRPSTSIIPSKRIKSASMARAEACLPLVDPGPAVKEEIVVLDHAAVEPDDVSASPLSAAASPSLAAPMSAGPMISGVASRASLDDDWDDDIEEIIYDLDVDSPSEVKPSVPVSDFSPVVVFPPRLPAFVDVSALPSTSLSDASADPGPSPDRSFASCSALDDHLDAIARRQVPVVAATQNNPLTLPVAPVLPRSVGGGAAKSDEAAPDAEQLRPMMKLLRESQTEISLQKLEVLGLQPVDEMFTRGTPAYALLKSCLYSQGKILSQLCPFKTEIKDPNVKSFFNTYVEAIVLICPSNLRDCYFSENPLWLVDLLTSESKRNSKVSVTAFIKDQARNGFKAEFKTKKGLLGKPMAILP